MKIIVKIQSLDEKKNIFTKAEVGMFHERIGGKQNAKG
jgi:hypothetical protein